MRHVIKVARIGGCWPCQQCVTFPEEVMEIIHAVGGRVPRTLSYEPAGPKHPTDKAKASRFTRILYKTQSPSCVVCYVFNF